MSLQRQKPDGVSTIIAEIGDAKPSHFDAGCRVTPNVGARGFRRFITLAEIVLDFLTSIGGVLTAYAAYLSLDIGRHLYYSPRELNSFAIIVGLLVVLLMERDGAYSGGTSLLRIRETERALKVPFTVLLLLLPPMWLVGQAFSRGAAVILLLILPALLTIQKTLFSGCVQALHARGYGIRRVLIYGAGDTGRRLLTALLHSPKLGYKPVGIVDDNPALQGRTVFELGYNRRYSLEVVKGPITEEYMRSVQCHTLFIAVPDLFCKQVELSLQSASNAKVRVAYLPGHRYVDAQHSESLDLDGLLLTFIEDHRASWPYLFLKRGMDLLIASVLLVALLPLFLLLVMLISADSPGGAIFRQERVGEQGKTFQIVKFRTMYVGAARYEKSPVLADDKRITRIGRVLRKTSLDELPQLLNVFKGEMSLVGPRPEMPFIVLQYGPVERQRLQIKPGITGLWQLSADRAFLIHESPEYDMYYIRNRSFFLDVAIIIHTALFAVRGI